MAKNQKKYTQEFKQQLVDLYNINISANPFRLLTGTSKPKPRNDAVRGLKSAIVFWSRTDTPSE